MDTVWLDYESRSIISLDERGLDNYVQNPSTQVLLAAYAFGDHKPKLWQPHIDPKIPEDLEEALTSPWVQVWSWNAAFEREVTKHVLGITKPIEEWQDPMVMARSLSYPGGLDEAGLLLGLGKDMAKLDTGKRLLRLFTEPEDEGGEETLFGISQPRFRDWNTDPADWKLFCEYCVQDVIAERAAAKKMKDFPVPDSEWRNWFMSEAINTRGWPCDMPLVNGAREIVLKELAPLTAQLKEYTNLENPHSRNQMLGWLQTQGYTFTSLNKDFVTRALDGECVLTDVAKKVLDIRSQTSKSSVSKYTALADITSEDGRLRHQYTFYGAHTGRWAAHGVNMGNLVRPTTQVEKNLDRAVHLVREMDYDGIVREFGKPLEVASSVQRSAFRAPAGKKFVVADLNAIENRGLGYLSRCEAILKVFREGKDPYLDFASRMYNEPYERLLAEYKAGDKTKRTICKPPVLGAGYGLGPGREEYVDGNLILTGLRGYAQKMGVEMTHEEAVYAIQVFRESYPQVKTLWKDMERAAAFAIRNPGHLTGVGVPQTDRDRDYFEEIGRKIHKPILSFKCTGTKVLEMVLPSGRSLYYIDPEVSRETKVWKFMENGQPREREYQQDVIYYKAKNQKTKQWAVTDTFGGHLVENADQAVCRDILVNGMKLATERGFEIVGHCYDEIITLVPLDAGLGINELRECMIQAPDWCGDAFPLGADGFEDVIYRKD